MGMGVAVLGATGVVGQKAIALLADHPYLTVTQVIASDRHQGKRFEQACDWREAYRPMPQAIAALPLSNLSDIQAPYLISCLPTAQAQSIEPALAARGHIVFSNASAFRMHAHVPLLIPEINRDHLSILSQQTTSGKIVTNPNCSAVGVCLALAPLQALGRMNHVSVVTLQSVSGAGYPGIASLDILANTVPNIPDEAEKITQETKKILGTAEHALSLAITTHVHRVPVLFGHTATLHITFDNEITPTEARSAYADWNQRYPNLFVLHDQAMHPQSARDLRHDDMRIHLGQIRQGDQANVLGLVVLSHNLVRGAAGAVIANMETYLRYVG